MNFIKNLSAIIIFILIYSHSHAWERQSDTTLMASLKAGFNKANVVGYDIFPEELICKNISLGISLNLSQEITINSGFGLFQKGFSQLQPHYNTQNISIGQHQTYFTFNYFNIPLNLQYNLGRKKLNIYIFGGFDINFLTKQRTHADLPSIAEGVKVNPYDLDQSDFYRKICFGYNVGTGVEYKIFPAFTVFMEYKLIKDFSNMYKPNVTGNIKHKLNSFNIGAKIGIPLKYNIR